MESSSMKNIKVSSIQKKENPTQEEESEDDNESENESENDSENEDENDSENDMGDDETTWTTMKII